MKRSRIGAIGLAFAACLAILTACGEQLATPQYVSEHDRIHQGTFSCLTDPCIYVSSTKGPGQLDQGRVGLYPGSGNGDVPPVAAVTGKRTELVTPYGVAVGPDHTIYAVNYGYNSNSGSVTAYAPGKYGDAAPEYTLQGLVTEIHDPTAIAVDEQSRVYLTNQGGLRPSVTVFAAGAKRNHPPLQWIRGAKTGLISAKSIAIDSSDNIYVSDYNVATNRVYRAGSTGNVYPMQTIGGSKTGINCAFAIGVDAGKQIYSGNSCGGPSGTISSILIFAAGAKGNVKPIASVVGPQTQLDGPMTIAFDTSGKMYVANWRSNSITVYAPGASGDVAPVQVIAGYKTKLKQFGVRGVAIR